MRPDLNLMVLTLTISANLQTDIRSFMLDSPRFPSKKQRNKFVRKVFSPVHTRGGKRKW